MPNTYVALRTETVAVATNSVTFDLTGISGYTDLVLVINATADSGNPDSRIKFNGNTSNNMSGTILTGNGTTASSARRTSLVQMEIDWTGMGTGIGQYAVHIMNYANTNVFKTFLVRSAFAAKGTDAIVGLWSNTAAITSITVDIPAGNYVAGSTFSLYGIANADQGAAKATGGIITEDSQYWYHTFGASGAFIPKQSLTCDVLVVGGGAGAAGQWGGGAGAGGIFYATSQALTATSYNVTVGGGGAGTAGYPGNGTNGTNTTFGALTAAVGGGKSGGDGGTGSNGGSGGGFRAGSGTFGTSTQTSTGGTGYGNSGGSATGNPSASGGGGAGGAGGASTGPTVGGAGGIGTALFSSWGVVTGTGQNVSGTVYYAGGGGGVQDNTARAGGLGGGGAGGIGNGNGAGISGTPNTGGGGGGGLTVAGGNGGSGLVIVRYAK